jgi:hypothetical protein
MERLYKGRDIYPNETFLYTRQDKEIEAAILFEYKAKRLNFESKKILI